MTYFENFTIGSKVLIYGKESIITGFYVSYNEGLKRYETIILTTGRGDPFERTFAGGDLKLIESAPIKYSTQQLGINAVLSDPDQYGQGREDVEKARKVWDDCEKMVLAMKDFATANNFQEGLIYMREMYFEQFYKKEEAQ